LRHVIYFLWKKYFRHIDREWFNQNDRRESAVWLGFSSYMVRAHEAYFNEQGKRGQRVISHRWPSGLSHAGQRGLNRFYNESVGCCYRDLCSVTRCRLNLLLSLISILWSRHFVVLNYVFRARRIAIMLFQAASYKY